MTVTDQIKILNRKIKQNEAQYDLDRKAAKISALSSNNLDKYEYLTGEDLGLKPSTVEQAKFEYSPLGKVFNKGLDKEEKKEGLLKRLKNIEDKNEELLKTTKNKTENVKEITDSVKESLSSEANALVEEIKIMQKDVDYRKLKIAFGNSVTHDFSNYKTFNKLFKDLYSKKMIIDRADEFNSILPVLNNYAPKNKKYIEVKNSLLNNARNFYEWREKIIKGFKDGIFPLNHAVAFEEEQQTSKRKSPNKPTKTDFDELNKQIIKEETEINEELFKNYLSFQKPTEMLKTI